MTSPKGQGALGQGHRKGSRSRNRNRPMEKLGDCVDLLQPLVLITIQVVTMPSPSQSPQVAPVDQLPSATPALTATSENVPLWLLWYSRFHLKLET